MTSYATIDYESEDHEKEVESHWKGPASTYFSNGETTYQTTKVRATCTKSGDSASSNGDGDPSVKRALAKLTGKCSCGAKFHRQKKN